MNGISAIVATYNRVDQLRRLLQSVASLRDIPLQMIIVDQNKNGLIDPLVEEYKTHLDINHLKLTEANQSKARNRGVALAKYDIICFPDDDCWFEKESIAKVANHFEGEKASDLLIINWKQNPNVISHSSWITKKQLYTFRSVGYVTYVLFFKKEVFFKLGGFVESIGIGMYIGGGEDSEMTFRTVSKGYTVYYDASIFVNHIYVSIFSRPLPVIRARQRALGMLYHLYDVPLFIILRGIISPFGKMLLAFNKNKIQQYYNLFMARIEGYRFAKKNKALLLKRSGFFNDTNG